MSLRLTKPVFQIDGTLAEVLPQIELPNLPPALESCRHQRIWMVITTLIDRFEQQVTSQGTFFEPPSNGQGACFTWKARGKLNGVVRQLRLDLMRQLEPQHQGCRVRLVIYNRHPLAQQPQAPAAAPSAQAPPAQAAPAVSTPPSQAARTLEGRNPRALPGNFYQTFFGFERMPFNNTPDSQFFFPAPHHKEALSRLVYAISERKGFVMISGEIGSGKSTLCRTLLTQIPQQIKTALITHTYLDERQLVRAIAEDLGLAIAKLSDYDVMQGLNQYLIEQLSQGCTVCIIIDEAQNLTPRALEAVRLISNLETEQEKLVQLILMGQPELRQKLEMEELRQLRQRIAVQYHLEPLSQDETLEYIGHRLAIANPAQPLEFKSKAMKTVYRYSGGIPRLINTLCDQALLTAFTQQTRKIHPRFIHEVGSDLQLDPQGAGVAQWLRFW